MSGSMGRAAAALRFGRGLARGLRMGVFFPPEGRLPGRPAPGGSTENSLPSPAGGPGGRLDALWPAGLALSQHRLPLAGIRAPLRLLQLSDVHLRGPDPALERLAAAMAPLRPDLVLLTGDIVTRGWQEPTVRAFLRSLPPAPLGRFAAMGNWEHWSGADPARWGALLASEGVTLLVEAGRDLGPLHLAATDDLLAGSLDLPRFRAALPATGPTVVMSHSPALFPALAGGAQLVLSGHSHGGQVRLPGLGAVWVPRGTGPYVAGWYQEQGSHLFVSRGLGWSIAPLRLSCPPELVEITLLPAG